MDELTIVRNLRGEQESPTPAAVTAGRAALFDRIGAAADPGTAARKAGVPNRKLVRPGLAALGAGALVAVLVFSDLVGLAGWRGGADPAAAAVLEQAAVAAITFEDISLNAGDYLLVERESVGVTSGQEAVGPVVYFRVRQYSQLYVPADREDEWIWVRPTNTLVDILTPGGEDLVGRYYATIDEETGGVPERLRATGGAFYGNTSDSQWGDYDSMPRDPYRLLNHIYMMTFGAGSSRDGEALVFIADTLRQGTAPADLRAALFRAAAMIPGVTVTEERAELDGSVGVAVGRFESKNGLRIELVFDPATGQLIGEREVAVDGYPEQLVKPGDVYRSSTVRMSVTDRAPEGGTPNGAFDVLGCTPGDRRWEWQCPPPAND